MKLLSHNPSDAAALTQLARDINFGEEVITILKAATIQHGTETLSEVLLQGQRLIKAKALVPHGQWTDWLAAHCPKSADTARNWMLVAANSERARNLIAAGAESMRELLGQLFPRELPGAPASGPAAAPWPPYLDALKRWSGLGKFISKHPVEEWPEEGRDKMREDVLPLAKSLWPDKFA